MKKRGLIFILGFTVCLCLAAVLYVGKFSTVTTGVIIDTNQITWPFPGYAFSGTSSIMPYVVSFGNTKNNNLSYNLNWSNNTNSFDNSINTVFRLGANQKPVSGDIVPGLGLIAEQMEFHYVPMAGQGVKEWHFIFAGADDIEHRFWSTQFDETNADIITSYANTQINWNYKTNSTSGAMQWVFTGNGMAANLEQFMSSGVKLHWQTNGGINPIILVADDSVSNPRQLINWDPTNLRLNIVNNGDIQAVQWGAEMWFPYNNGLGLQGAPSRQPKWLVTANGGISAGGLNDPGAGNVEVTNHVTLQSATLLPSFAGTGGALINSNRVLYWVTSMHTNSLNGTYVFTNNVAFASASQLVNAPHGLPYTPVGVRWVLNFTTADVATGYQIGDEVDAFCLRHATLNGSEVFASGANATNIFLSTATAASPALPPKGGGAIVALTSSANFVLKCYVQP